MDDLRYLISAFSDYQCQVQLKVPLDLLTKANLFAVERFRQKAPFILALHVDGRFGEPALPYRKAALRAAVFLRPSPLK